MKANPKLVGPSSPVGPTVPLSMLAAAGLLLAGCTGGGAGDPDNRGDFKVNSISTGSGAVYPYRVRQLTSTGVPTSTVVNIESEAILRANVNSSNGVLPVATLPTTTVLPDGNAGNHFLHFAFSHKLQVDSILSNLLSDQSSSGLRGSLLLLAYDPSTETTVTIPGRGFVNGFTYFNEGGVLRQVRAVEANGALVTILDPRAAGFPNYPGAADLVTNKSFTFVADTDNNLQTLEQFPANRVLRLVVTNAVRDSENDILEQEISTATTVGPDTGPPEILGYTTVAPQILPGNGQIDVDPTQSILVRFNKPVQPAEVGRFFNPTDFTPPNGGLRITVTAAATTFPILYYADPVSYGDLMNYIVRPSYLPGNSLVDVGAQAQTVRSLNLVAISQTVNTNFRTGAGPGLVNAPVAPEAIYIGISGAEPGVAVVDLNGFGQGTGNLATTRVPLNPVRGAPGVVPPMTDGTSSFDAGGAGALTLTQDTNGGTRLLRDPQVSAVDDIHIGAPLDLLFNNENINRNASRANQINPWLGIPQSGNTMSQPPVPNPPKLTNPPPNPSRLIFAEEPIVNTSFAVLGQITTGGPPAPGCAVSPINPLQVGNPYSNIQTEVGVYGTFFMGVFVGPQPAPPSPPPPAPFCPFTCRQQIGHFLYVLDRDNRQILVLNSNRFTILDTIRLSDPVSMAVSPSLNRMAVTNFSSATVSFIDINPLSNNFHEVVTETRVDSGPTGIAWQPDGEDILVLSTDANLLTILSGIDFRIRRTVGGFLNAPIDVVISERFNGNGNLSGVYYAYILNGNGSVAIYESGPDGVNGIGFNDIIGTVADANFPRARSMCFDFASQQSGVFIGHQDDQGLGQVSRLTLESTPVGQQPLNPIATGFILPPTYRQKQWRVTQRIGGVTPTTPVADLLSGGSVADICPDDLVNLAGLPGQNNLFSPTYATTPFSHSGKHVLKVQPNGAVARAVNPKFLFIALSDVGVVDVFEISSGTKVRSIPVPGVRVVSNYWRQ
jgi:hypothetical protein